MTGNYTSEIPSKSGIYFYKDDGGGPTEVEVFERDGELFVKHVYPKSKARLMATGVELDGFAMLSGLWALRFAEDITEAISS